MFMTSVRPKVTWGFELDATDISAWRTSIDLLHCSEHFVLDDPLSVDMMCAQMFNHWALFLSVSSEKSF